MKAMRIHRHGGPEEFRYEEVELAPPGPGEVRVRHRAIAVNFSDVNLRRGGFYLGAAPAFPLILGNEAVGVLDGGERVAYVGSGGAFYENTGAYAEARNIPARLLVPLPEGLPDRAAAALMLKGLTASMLIHRCYRPAKGDAVLVHAAASGVGLLLVQWLKHLGATVIGTVGSAEKAQAARAAGCEHVVLYRDLDFGAAVRQLVPRGVAAVFDGVGRDTWLR
jgi:NADPH2:quinone reductase